MSCASRRAHARPAGPPPTMTTSASICGRVMPSRGLRKTITWALRSRFHFLHFLNQRRNDVEQVADYAVIGDLEDRSLGVFVDGDDGARALHAHNMLNGAADAERKIKIGSDGLAGAPDRTVLRTHTGIAH